MAEACRLREPVWLMALLALGFMFALGFIAVVFAANGFSAWSPRVARALAFPSAVATGLAAGAIAGRLRRLAAITRADAIIRGAIGWGAVGAAWPASFLLGDVLQGRAVMLAAAFAPILEGAIIGAVAGALAAGAAGVLFLTPAAARPSPEPPRR
jgi:hypothetical protein